MYKLVLIRHGESTWNLENRFTGWTDVDLTPTGVSQAMSAGKLLKAEGWDFDLCYIARICISNYIHLHICNAFLWRGSSHNLTDAMHLLDAKQDVTGASGSLT